MCTQTNENSETLEKAIACLEEQRKYGKVDSTKIGVVEHEFGGIGPLYRVGDYVLFRRYPLESNLGEVIGHHLTVERPMSLEQIRYWRAKGSGLTTVGTIVAVPDHYVREVNVEQERSA